MVFLRCSLNAVIDIEHIVQLLAQLCGDDKHLEGHIFPETAT
jgi:hypothetical protein